MEDTISPADLAKLLASDADVTVLDVRRRGHRARIADGGIEAWQAFSTGS